MISDEYCDGTTLISPKMHDLPPKYLETCKCPRYSKPYTSVRQLKSTMGSCKGDEGTLVPGVDVTWSFEC